MVCRGLTWTASIKNYCIKSALTHWLDNKNTNICCHHWGVHNKWYSFFHSRLIIIPRAYSISALEVSTDAFSCAIFINSRHYVPKHFGAKMSTNTVHWHDQCNFHLGPKICLICLFYEYYYILYVKAMMPCAQLFIYFLGFQKWKQWFCYVSQYTLCNVYHHAVISIWWILIALAYFGHNKGGRKHWNEVLCPKHEFQWYFST